MGDPAARAEAADLLVAGETIIIPFNGIFVLVGDADDPAVPEKIAAAKQRPQAKGVALVCPPEFLGEHVATDAATTSWTLAQVQKLYSAVHAIGVILPAAEPGAPPHVVQAGTILNVWTEERPSSALRELVLELRRRGRRALVGTSANQSGQPTITESTHATAVFAPRVSMILLDTFDHVPRARRRSASIVDLTGSAPRLARQGSVTAEELREHLRRLQLGELMVRADVPRV
jgi:L-threonylcarbamoyladenylate synthase